MFSVKTASHYYPKNSVKIQQNSRAKQNKQYTPQLVNDLLKDSDLRQSSQATLQYQSKHRQTSVYQSSASNSNVSEKYDEIFRENINLYKKVSLYKQIIRQSITNIRAYTEVFVKDLLNIEHLNHLTEVTVQEYLVKILKVCKDIQTLNIVGKKSELKKTKRAGLRSRKSSDCSSRDHDEDHEQRAGNFIKKANHIFIVEDQEYETVVHKKQQKYEPLKSELLDLIEQDEQYSSNTNSFVNQEHQQSQNSYQIHKEKYSQLMPVSSLADSKHRKKELSSIIDHFSDRLDKKSSCGTSIHFQSSQSSINVQSKLTDLKKKHKNSFSSENSDIKEQSSISKQNENELTFEEEEENELQSYIEEEDDAVPEVSAFESRLPNKSYGDFNSACINVNESTFTSANKTFFKQKQNLTSGKDDLNKENYPQDSSFFYSEKTKRSFLGDFLQSHVLSRRKIFQAQQNK